MAGAVYTLLGLAASALLTVAFAALKDWLIAHRSIRVSTAKKSGPTSVEFGFTEASGEVAVLNRKGEAVDIEDLRLMFARRHGAPLPEPPPPRTLPELPARLEPGAEETWHFPAEKLASLLQFLSSMPSPGRRTAKLRPCVATTAGKVYRGRSIRFSMDVDSHWP